MPIKVEQRAVLLLVADRLKIDRDVTIPAGEYSAVEQHFIKSAVDEKITEKRPAIYLLELTGEQLHDFGSESLADYASVEFDVTEFVRRGSALVAVMAPPPTVSASSQKPH